MPGGQTAEVVVQSRDVIALIAVLAGEQGLLTECAMRDSITENEKREVAKKLRGMADQVEGR